MSILNNGLSALMLGMLLLTMQLSAIYSIWEGIWYLPITTGTSGSVRLQNGKGRWHKRSHRIPVVRR